MSSAQEPTWLTSLRPPWPTLDLFLNTPTVRWEKGVLRISWDGGEKGIPAEDAVFDPEAPLGAQARGKKLLPGFVTDRGMRLVQGMLCGGYTSSPINMEEEAFLQEALVLWGNAGRPGPIHPMTLACLLVSPPPYYWLLVAMNPLAEWEEQERAIKGRFRAMRDALRTGRAAGPEWRPPRRGKLELGKKVLAFTLFHYLGKRGKTLEGSIPKTEPRAIREHLLTVRKRLHAGLTRRAEQILGAAIGAHNLADANDRAGSGWFDQVKLPKLLSNWYASVPRTCRLKQPK